MATETERTKSDSAPDEITGYRILTIVEICDEKGNIIGAQHWSRDPFSVINGYISRGYGVVTADTPTSVIMSYSGKGTVRIVKVGK